tara:strand:- start:48 stop:950 length:903 start_codon:yes stop_codon:yes gene_type:complete
MKIIFHVGYPKVMSKFLQTKFFYNLKSLNYLDHKGKSYLLYHKIRDFVFFKSDEEFEKQIFNLQEDILSNLSKNKTNLLSDEIYLWPSKLGYNKVFDRISKIFNFQNRIDFSLIIITRDQTEIFLSMYAENQEIFTNLDPKFTDFNVLIEDLFLKRKLDNEKLNFLNCLNFNKVSNFLFDKYHFKIHIFDYDNLVHKDHNTFKYLSKLLNCKTNYLVECFAGDPVHKTRKINGAYYLKNQRLTNLYRILSKNNKFKSIFPLELKFYIKDKLNSIFGKKLKFDKEKLIYIKKFYQEKSNNF